MTSYRVSIILAADAKIANERWIKTALRNLPRTNTAIGNTPQPDTNIFNDK